MRKRLVVLWVFCNVLLFGVSAYAHENDRRDDVNGNNRSGILKRIPLPNGFQPEGVAKGPGHLAYAGSLLTGSIYQVDLLSGEGSLLVDRTEGVAVGLAYDKRSRYLYVAGGPQGTVTVYETKHGRQLTVFELAQSGAFINDGVVAEKAAFFTDSFRPVLYSIPLGKEGKLHGSAKTSELSGDFEFIPGGFNANGIELSLDGHGLYIVNSSTGKLYLVDPNTGFAKNVAISNGDVSSGDGLVLRGGTLFVAQNYLNQVTELSLSEDGLSASIERIITDADFRIPTTALLFGKALYVVNARFDVAPPPLFGTPPADPGLDYDMVRVEIAH